MRHVFTRWTSITSLLALTAPLSLLSLELQAEDPVPAEQVVVLIDESEEKTAAKEKQSEANPLWLGIVLKAVDGDLAAYLQNDKGIFVDGVMPESPAAKADIQVGDILLSANGQELNTPGDLLEVMRKVEPSQEPKPVELVVLRRGERNEIAITPAQRPEETPHKKDLEKRNAQAYAERQEEVAEAGKAGIPELMKRLREGRVEKEMNIFRFGEPSVLFDAEVAEQHKLSGDIDIKIVRKNEDGELEVSVKRQEGQPPKITVTQDGEAKEYTDMDKLPANIRELVAPLLHGSRPMIRMLRVGPAGEREMELRTDHLELIDPEAKEQIEQLHLSKELAERYRQMAVEMAERSKAQAEKMAHEAREAANRAMESNRRASALPKEIEELRGLVDQLREEVKQLKAERDRDDQ